MTRIFTTKSKLSVRYKADLWHFFWRRKAKLTRATRLFFKRAREKSGVRKIIQKRTFRKPRRKVIEGYLIFARLTAKLLKKRNKRSNHLARILRNSARLRIFFGIANKRQLKVLFKGCWSGKATDSKICTSFESIIRCFLFRIHFIRSFREGKYFISRGFFKVNRKIIFNWNHRINIGDVVTFKNFTSYEILIYIFFIIREMLYFGRFLWGVPPYVLVDWRVLAAKLYRPINSAEVIFPFYGINLVKAIRYCRKPLY